MGEPAEDANHTKFFLDVPQADISLNIPGNVKTLLLVTGEPFLNFKKSFVCSACFVVSLLPLQFDPKPFCQCVKLAVL